jgi:uncharacterized protein YndB with AHSA1/START domain
MFHTTPRPGFDGKVFCEVLAIEPQRKIVYSWKGGPAPGKISLDSTVTWTFSSHANGTDVQLEHSGFKVMKNYMAYIFMGAGWATKIRKRLTELLNQASHEKAHS